MQYRRMCRLLLIGCSLLLVHVKQVAAAPQIEFVGGPTFDFEYVKPNTDLSHDFVFKNTGDAVLRIESIAGS